MASAGSRRLRHRRGSTVSLGHACAPGGVATMFLLCPRWAAPGGRSQQRGMQDPDTESLRAAIAALEAQRGALGDAVLELATAPLRARLAGLLRPTGLQPRQVTVLFANVVGSTAMAQGLGAEDTLNVLSRGLRRMAALVEAHQGRVLRFTGDGLKAVATRVRFGNTFDASCWSGNLLIARDRYRFVWASVSVQAQLVPGQLPG
jgi:hypothetical protein